MPSTDYLIELGRYLERVNTHSEQIQELDHRVTHIETDISTVKAWASRVATAGALWAAGLGLSLKSNDIGALLARMIKAGIAN